MDTPDEPAASQSRRSRKYGARDWLLLIVTVVPFLAVVAVAGSLVFSAYVASSWGAGPYDGRPEVEFTQEAWLAAANDDDGQRYLMLKDLLRKEPLVGLTRDELEVLLGPLIPPTEHPGGGWCYYLGPEPGAISIDSIWLDIEFDAADVVVAIDTWTD